MLNIILPMDILVKYFSYILTMSLTKVMEEVRISREEPPTCLQAVDRWLQTQSDQTKDYTICICCFSYRGKTGLLGTRIKCPSGTTYVSADCCFSEPTL